MPELKDGGILWSASDGELTGKPAPSGAAVYSRGANYVLTEPDAWDSVAFTADEEATGCFERVNGHITCTRGGVIAIAASARFEYIGGGNVTRKFAIRVTKNGSEVQTLKAVGSRERGEDEADSLHAVGLMFTEPGDVIALQARVSAVDVVVKGGEIFDDPNAATIAVWHVTDQVSA